MLAMIGVNCEFGIAWVVPVVRSVTRGVWGARRHFNFVIFASRP